jgi:outer membrane protein OmpA-like peptidoglycan-associated protein
MYSSQGHAPGFAAIQVGKKDPFELYEAENAVQLARIAGADRYASESFRKAQDALDQAIKYQVQHPGQKPVVTMAREACVRAEDSRVIAIRAERTEADNNERAAALARENAANAQADASRAEAEREAHQRELAEADRATAEQARASAERAKVDALAAAQTAQQERAAAELAKQQADAARQDAVAQQQQLALETEKARAAAADADARRLQAEQDQTELRRQLLLQFNTILQTRDTARGLIVNMSDVLFDTARFSLKPGAREKLAKVAGIILGHPGLKIAVEGHTDSVGGDDYNMKLSENRANAVRDYLLGQGLNGGSITAEGFGKTRPVADNSTSAGRQQNRRVELVVSGEILGAPLTGKTSGDQR